MTEIKSILGIDSMDDPKTQWNDLRDAARTIYRKKGFNRESLSNYQGWAKADEKKKSAARARVCPLPIVSNGQLVSDPRFTYLDGYMDNWPCDVIFSSIVSNKKRATKRSLQNAKDDEVTQDEVILFYGLH
jgi:hypothetical protein